MRNIKLFFIEIDKFVRTFFLPFLLTCSCVLFGSEADSTYTNPIIMRSLPDPSVIRVNNGTFYLYATEDTQNLPIWKSDNLVDWFFVGTSFSENSHPKFLSGGMIWAPDVAFINKKYVLYYSLSKRKEYERNGIGIATSKTPDGPFRDRGKLFTSEEIGVKNSIDPFYFEDNGEKYLFWGSFRGIFGIELAKNGLSLKRKAVKKKIAGTFMEATAIEKRNGYYYLFGSVGSCCDGANSKYHIVYGRSKSLFGPYVTKDGKLLLENNYEILLYGNEKVAGPGHQSRLITDDKGQDWIIYHGYLKENPKQGRVVFLDKIDWVDGWPRVLGEHPSDKSQSPYFRK